MTAEISLTSCSSVCVSLLSRRPTRPPMATAAVLAARESDWRWRGEQLQREQNARNDRTTPSDVSVRTLSDRPHTEWHRGTGAHKPTQVRQSSAEGPCLRGTRSAGGRHRDKGRGRGAGGGMDTCCLFVRLSRGCALGPPVLQPPSRRCRRKGERRMPTVSRTQSSAAATTHTQRGSRQGKWKLFFQLLARLLVLDPSCACVQGST
jgi:hypothetical protein